MYQSRTGVNRLSKTKAMKSILSQHIFSQVQGILHGLDLPPEWKERVSRGPTDSKMERTLPGFAWRPHDSQATCYKTLDTLM